MPLHRNVRILAKCRHHGLGRFLQLEDQIYVSCLKNRFTVFDHGVFYRRGLYVCAVEEIEGYRVELSGAVLGESCGIKFSKSYPKITITSYEQNNQSYLLKYLLYQICLQLCRWKKQPFGLAYYRLQKQGMHTTSMDKTFKIVAKRIHNVKADRLDILRR